MEIKDIINEGRPVEPYSFETDNEVTWYKIGANDGYEYALEEFENNRLKACDNQTPEQAWRESEFVVPFVKEHHRTPTFSDAIEVTRKQMVDKAVKYLSGLTRCAVSCIGEDVNVPILSKEQLADFIKVMEE